MLDKLIELKEANPARFKKYALVAGAVAIILSYNTFSEEEVEKAAKPNVNVSTQLDSDVFSLKNNEYNFNDDALMGEVESIKKDINTTKTDSAEMIATLSKQVEELTKLVAKSQESSKETALHVDKELKARMALYDRKQREQLGKLRKALQAAYKKQGTETAGLEVAVGELEQKINSKVFMDSTGREIVLDDEKQTVFHKKIKGSEFFPEPVDTAQAMNIFSDDTTLTNAQEKQEKTIVAKADSAIDSVKNTVAEIFTNPTQKPQREVPKTEEFNIIPAGSILSGVLVSGVDMPTSTASRKDPIPVFVRLSGQALLPNRERVNVDGCVVVTSGYGDMSTERIYLRSNSISCINADGRVTETGLNSTIVSTQDAMAGIRGQLVSRSSKLIGNSLLAGTLSGLSQGLTPKPLNSFTDQGDENQVFQYSSLSDVANFGAMSGASTALEKIADYYIELAEKAQPVISVRAGAEVDLMLTTGLKLKSGD
jgi:hypothetical protein